jgi:penicillin-binding protein 2
MSFIPKFVSYSRPRRALNPEPEPEEVFLDVQNLPGFDTARFEGKLEQPIGGRIFGLVGSTFLLLGLVLLGRAGYLTVLEGSEFRAYAENNHLRSVIITSQRGIIYDRNLKQLATNLPGFRVSVESLPGVSSLPEHDIKDLAAALHRDSAELAHTILTEGKDRELYLDLVYDWQTANRLQARFKNQPRIKVESTTIRSYTDDVALSPVIGYVSKISKEDIEEDVSFSEWTQRGRAGIELQYDNILRGQPGKRLVEIDSHGRPLSEGMVQAEQNGQSLVLSISSALIDRMYDVISRYVDERGFSGGAAVMLDVHTGEVLGLTSYPSYDANALSHGAPANVIQEIFNNPNHPLLNRAISGLYPPASTAKPFVAVAALSERIISPTRKIVTNGHLVLPNPYDASRPTVLDDWRDQGTVDMYQAIAMSSNVYFWTLGGGFGDVQGLGLSRIRKYFTAFGLGSLTGIDLPGEEQGIVPSEEWKAQQYPRDPTWRIGDTYNMSIGQGGTLATPIQMASAVLGIARNGELLQPHLALGTLTEQDKISYFNNQKIIRDNIAPANAFQVVHEAMRKTVVEGTAQALSVVSVPFAGKSGTGQFNLKGRVHSWFIGFAPYNKPDYALVVLLENGSEKNLIGAPAAASEIMQWFVKHKDEVL